MKHPDFDSALEALKAWKEDTVPASMLAPILNMSPGRIVKYAKNGTWDQDLRGGFIISGEGPQAHVKFFKRDFLIKNGLMDPEPETKTDSDRLDELIELLRVQNTMLIEIGAYIKRSASAATPTE